MPVYARYQYITTINNLLTFFLYYKAHKAERRALHPVQSSASFFRLIPVILPFRMSCCTVLLLLGRPRFLSNIGTHFHARGGILFSLILTCSSSDCFSQIFIVNFLQYISNLKIRNKKVVTHMAGLHITNGGNQLLPDWPTELLLSLIFFFLLLLFYCYCLFFIIIIFIIMTIVS